MTFITPDQRTSSAPNGNRLSLDELEHLITADIKPFGWRRTVEEVERLTKLAEADERREIENIRIAHEHRRRAKLESLHAALNAGRTEQHREIIQVEPEAERDLGYLKSGFRMTRLFELFCDQTGADADNIISSARHRKVALQRHILMWILRRNVKDQLYNRPKSHPEIGRFMGRRDHSSVIHGINRIENNRSLREKARLIERDVLLAEFERYGG